MKQVLAFTIFAASLVVPASAQVSLSGASAWTSDSTGTRGVGYWDTVEGIYGNVYFFTGTTGTPTFLNSGNTNASLVPGVSLATGANLVQFAANSTQPSYTGINLFFDGDLTQPRISGLVQNGGTTSFSPVTAATTTWGEGVSTNGAESFSYTTGGFTVTLTSLSALSASSSLDLVGNFVTGASGEFDTVVSMTLVVSAVPEPATCAALAGLAALGIAAYGRRRNSVGSTVGP